MPVCDCSKPQTQGLLDLTDPKYCGSVHADYPKQAKEEVNYEIITKVKKDLEWKGLTCSEWTVTKKITGSFWIGSYDTEHFHNTRLVSQEECWNMVQSETCGGNKIVKNDKTYSFVQEPVGEGSWYSIKEFTIINCLAHEITLRQEEPGGPIRSPFGYHNVSISQGKFEFNHNTIVWHQPTPPVEINCGNEVILKGKGKLSITKVDNNLFGKIMDKDKQIEALFDTHNDSICSSIHHAYKITGIPNTHITLQKGLLTHFQLIHKRSIEYSTDTLVNNFASITNKERYSHLYAWGFIRLLTNDNLFLTSGAEDSEIYLNKQTPNANLNEGPKQEIISQTFEYLTNNTIRRQNTNLCVTAITAAAITLTPCDRSQSQWLIDRNTKQIVEINTLLCLTATNKILFLTECNNNSNQFQSWQIENVNMHPEFLETNPVPSIEDLEFTNTELRSAATSYVQNIDDIYFWGNLINKRTKHSKSCITSNVDDTSISMKSCIILEKKQEFEYASDYTIRKFGTNICLNANVSFSHLSLCTSESQRFGPDLLSGQIMELHSAMCLQHTQDKKLVHLGECGENQAMRRQKWQFQFYNPNLDNAAEKPYLTKNKILEFHRLFNHLICLSTPKYRKF